MARAREPAAPPRAGAGYAYLALLFAVVLVGAGLGGAAQVWHTTMQREREQQLLWVGHQYRQAIRLYYAGGNAAAAGATAAPGAPGGRGAAAGPAISVAVPSGPQTEVSGPTAVGGAPSGSTVAGTAPGAAATGQPAAGRNLPGGPSRYPPTLEALLSDPRNQQIRRYLRRLYADPITGNNDWVLITAPNGGIMGVRSASEAKTLKRAHFAPEDNEFTGKEHYSDWTFTYLPTQRGQRFAAPPVVPPPMPNYGPAPGVQVSPNGQSQ